MTIAALPQPDPRPFSGMIDDLRNALRGHYLRLGEASRRLRFMAPISDATIERIAARCSPDLVLHLDVDGVTRGVLELYCADGGHAEIGISIEDRLQGLGLGRSLFQAGLTAAAEMGVKTADMHFCPDNRGIRRLVSEAGGRTITICGESEAHIDIDTFLARKASA